MHATALAVHSNALNVHANARDMHANARYCTQRHATARDAYPNAREGAYYSRGCMHAHSSASLNSEAGSDIISQM